VPPSPPPPPAVVVEGSGRVHDDSSHRQRDEEQIVLLRRHPGRGRAGMQQAVGGWPSHAQGAAVEGGGRARRHRPAPTRRGADRAATAAAGAPGLTGAAGGGGGEDVSPRQGLVTSNCGAAVAAVAGGPPTAVHAANRVGGCRRCRHRRCKERRLRVAAAHGDIDQHQHDDKPTVLQRRRPGRGG